jgi:hypothetical protein
MQGAQAQKVGFNARVCSNFVEKKFFKRGVALIL